MKKKVALYNVIFPIWMLVFLPPVWLVVLPANFIIDLVVILLTLKFMKVEGALQTTRRIIVKSWLFGFLSDIIGALPMLALLLIDSPGDSRWYKNLVMPVAMNPFSSLPAFLWVLGCMLLAAALIYLFNSKIAFRKLELPQAQKNRLALSLALFTAPYLFLLPTDWFI